MSARWNTLMVLLAATVFSGFARGDVATDPPANGKAAGSAAVVDVQDPRATVITADSLHTCALTSSGDAYCWGTGSFGRLGNGSTAEQLTPVAVAGSRKFVSISAGSSHTCALTADGKAYCWGNGGNGRLGTGNTNRSLRPRLVVGGHEFSVLSVGRRYTCGLTNDGTAYCWGVNSNGELGDGTTEDKTEPTAVVGGHKFTWLSAGAFHSCGVATDGKTYCWGSGTNGKRGDGATTGGSSEPVAVSTDVSFTSVYAGRQHTCALTAEGEAWCWGANRSRQLGDGTNTAKSTPVRVKTDLKFKSLALGGTHTCGLTASGKVYCWGSNNLGKLGKGDAGGTFAEPQEVALVNNFVAIEAGYDHTCGKTADGAVYCWGGGEGGRLGHGTLADRSAPDRVADFGTDAPTALLPSRQDR